MNKYPKNIKLPTEVKYIIETLEKSGYIAYAVGGCVRDSVMGKTPKDWDICTSALPEQTKKSFEKERVIETGLKHGTISLLLDKKTYEITTFRTDGHYTDNRRPDTVNFVPDLETDLKRRDFTINALAYHPEEGMIDYFGGVEDIKRKLLRCVGEADKRFKEDALRIMRALRFSSTLNFEIEHGTLEAIMRNRKLPGKVAVERIREELDALLLGENVENVLKKHSKVLETIIPEIAALVGFDQKNSYHDLDIWSHTAKAVANASPDRVVRLALLLHDIAKPECYTETKGVGHFYGHPEAGAEKAERILSRLKYDKETIKTVINLILYHDADIEPEDKAVKRWLNRLGVREMRLLCQVKMADTTAKSSERIISQIAEIEEITAMIDEIVENRSCFTLQNLEISGTDLINCGIPEGEEIGKTLQELLEQVINSQLPNEKEPLLAAVRQRRARNR